MKGILINPFLRTVDWVDVDHDAEGATYAGIRRHIQPPNGYVEHVSIGAGHGLWVDEEGLFVPWERQAFFALGAGERARDFAGIGLILRDVADRSESCVLPITLVRDTVRWLDPREVVFNAPRMTTVGKDGTIETTLLEGVDKWTFDQQPKQRSA